MKSGLILLMLASAINAQIVPSSQVATWASGLIFNRISQTFNGTVTVRNIGGSAISGPLQILFSGLTPGVTLVNATGILSGTPYLTVPAAVTSLAPRQLATVSLTFANPSNAVIDFVPVIYSGNQVPTIGSLSPSSVVAGAAAQTLTINGANFVSTSTVTFNGAARAVTFVSANGLTIPLTASDQSAAGTYPVVVTNPPPGGGPSTAANFAVTTTPAVSLSTTGISFGFWTVGTTSPVQEITLTNTGNATLNIGSVGVSGPNPGDFHETDTCVGSVAAGHNCTISLTTAPLSAGSRSASLTINDNAANSPESVSLSATGLTSASQFMVLDPTKTFLINTVTGKPVFMTAEDAFDLLVEVDNADVMTYLTDRASRGYSTMWVAAADNEYQANAPDNWYGQAPFNGADFTNENELYWQNVDLVVQEAQSLGITLTINPAFVGLTSSDGYLDSYLNSSDAVISAFGQWIGSRYARYSNIVWLIGGDSNITGISGLRRKMSDLATGIAAADPNHLITSEECRICGTGVNSTLDIWGKAPWVGLNGVYSDYADAQSQCVGQYALLTTYPTVPPFEIEDWYEGEHSMTELQLREEGYWEILSGCYLGRYFGNNAIWTMGGPSDTMGQTWQSQLSSAGSVSHAWLGALFRSREHWKMVPDSQNLVLTAGYGSGTAISVASRTSDGQTIIAYIPNGNGTSVTINMAKITSAANTAICWWFNPATGATTQIGSFAATGTHVFTPPDSNDWVLVIDDADADLPAPGTKNL